MGIEIDLEAIPVSKAAAGADKKALITFGDDYELAFTVPAGRARDIAALSRDLALPLTRIGRATRGTGVLVLDREGQNVDIKTKGYRHFGP